MELITRKWSDINRKVQKGGLWALITIVVAAVMRQLDVDGEPQVVVDAMRSVLEQFGPLIPIIAGYFARETKQPS